MRKDGDEKTVGTHKSLAFGVNLNPPPNLGIITEITGSWKIPDHQQGIRCKAPRSDD
jgi:hypothetical protein